MMNPKLSTQPYKGSRDFYPEDMRVRNYIFNKWRETCEKYGYEEYDGPFIENFDIYAAKSGEEIVNEQLYSFVDRGKRKVAIRPEMTPTLSRMVSARFSELPKPIKWYSIPNLWRYEKPQKGRLREHFQLNLDMFGVEGVSADVEILQILIDILTSFGATEEMFEIRVGNRRIVDEIYKKLNISNTKEISRIIDKKLKITNQEFENLLQKSGLNLEQVESIVKYLDSPTQILEEFKDKQGTKEITDLLDLCKELGINKYVKYDPLIMRGFDYYTGNVFELYDLNPENPRAMCGGGRYDDLITLFTGQRLTGIGFGMGDVTFKNFLEDWNLLPTLETKTQYLVTLWPVESQKYLKVSMEVSKILRQKNKMVLTYLEENTKLDKQLKYADKLGIKNVIIIGETELLNNQITIKDMISQSQETIPLEKFISSIQ